MVTTLVEVATARRPSLGRKGSWGCSRFTFVLVSAIRQNQTTYVSTVNQKIMSVEAYFANKALYLSATAGGLPASCRTPL